MATVKGQNLRIYVEDTNDDNLRCIAAATSCTLHAAAQVQEKSTKDSVGSWAQNEVVGLSWDVSVDALIVEDHILESGSVVCSEQEGAYFIYPNAFTLDAGDTIKVDTQDHVYILDEQFEILDNDEYTATGPGESVYIAAESENTVFPYEIIDGSGIDLEYLFDNLDTDVLVELSATTGLANRETEDVLLRGYAKVTDISVNAPNRQDSSYTVTFTGTGDLETV